MPTGVLGFRAQRSQFSIQQDELGREVRTSRLLVSKVFLAEFNISPTTSAVITTNRWATSPTRLRVSSCRCSEGSLVLLKSPRRAAPIMDRKASTATTNSVIFSSFHVIEICDCIACDHRHDCR